MAKDIFKLVKPPPAVQLALVDEESHVQENEDHSSDLVSLQ